MSAKMATLKMNILEIKVFWNKGYDVIFSFHDVTNHILSHDWNYTVPVFMWPKFGNSSISMRKCSIITSILQGFNQKKHFFFESWSWFGFNNLGLALGMSLKVYNSVVIRLKLKVKKVWRLIPVFLEVTGE